MEGSPAPPRRPATLRTGLRMSIRGRSLTLRGLHRPPAGILRWLAILGPGMIADAAGNDAGGIAMYSTIGAAERNRRVGDRAPPLWRRF